MTAFSNKGVFGRSWGGLNWSSWLPVDDAKAFTEYDQPGLYRVRANQTLPLLYIGESRNLKGRIAAIRYEKNHAAVGLIQFLDALANPNVEVSLSASVHDRSRHSIGVDSDRQRESIERYLMWRHRIETGSSVMCAHGRGAESRHRLLMTHPRIKELPRISTPGIQPSSCALPATGKPDDPYWMGLEWGPFFQFTDALKRYSSRLHKYRHYGLYKILDVEFERVLYIGYASYVWGQAQANFREWGYQPKDAVVSVHPLLPGIPRAPFLRYFCLERRDDLIGGHHHQYGQPPKFQF